MWQTETLHRNLQSVPLSRSFSLSSGVPVSRLFSRVLYVPHTTLLHSVQTCAAVYTLVQCVQVSVHTHSTYIPSTQLVPGPINSTIIKPNPCSTLLLVLRKSQVTQISCYSNCLVNIWIPSLMLYVLIKELNCFETSCK